jgi:hypothetical protein
MLSRGLVFLAVLRVAGGVISVLVRTRRPYGD